MLLYASPACIFFLVEVRVSGSPHYGGLIPRTIDGETCRTMAETIRAPRSLTRCSPLLPAFYCLLNPLARRKPTVYSPVLPYSSLQAIIVLYLLLYTLRRLRSRYALHQTIACRAFQYIYFSFIEHARPGRHLRGGEVLQTTAVATRKTNSTAYVEGRGRKPLNFIFLTDDSFVLAALLVALSPKPRSVFATIRPGLYPPHPAETLGFQQQAPSRHPPGTKPSQSCSAVPYYENNMGLAEVEHLFAVWYLILETGNRLNAPG